MSDGRTDVIYNNVILRNVQTRQWDQELVYDDSGTDLLFTRYRLSFEGILHLESAIENAPMIGHVDSGSASYGNLGYLYRYVRQQLTEPRRNLSVTMNGVVVLRVASPVLASDALTPIDLDNGPKPQSVNLTHLTGGKVFRVRFSVDCAVGECDQVAGDSTTIRSALPQNVLNHRWSIDETMDANFFTTRTITGKIRFSNSRFTPHAYKNLIIPFLERGFRRESIQFSASPTGLEASYTVVDRQVHTSAPWPATAISGTHAETTGDGVNFFSECAVKLTGPPNADKRLLITRAIQVIDSRLKILSESINYDWQIESAAIIDHFGEENSIEARMRIRQMKSSPRMALGGLLLGDIGKPLHIADLEGQPETYRPSISPKPAAWGYPPYDEGERRVSVLLLMHCYLQSPCSPRHAMMGVQSPGEPEEEDGPPDVQEYPHDPSGGEYQPPAAPEDKVSPNAKNAVYTYAKMESQYRMTPSRTMLPLSKTFGSGAATRQDTCVAVSFGGVQATREISIDVERVGEWPAIPEPLDQYVDGDLRGYLLDHWIRPHPPCLTPDGQKTIHRIAAHYVYGLNRPPTPEEKLAVGVLPVTNLTAAETSIVLRDLYDDQLLPGNRVT